MASIFPDSRDVLKVLMGYWANNDVETQFDTDTRCVMFSRSIAYDIPSTIAFQSTCFNEDAFESVRSPISSNISPIPFFHRTEG